MTKRVGLVLSLMSALVLAGTSVAVFAESHARIIRVSYLDGQVQMDRATGQGLERAMLNAPVVQGASIVTGKDGLAEIEFEDQSALRLTGNSEVRFHQLSMNDAGLKTNDIEVVKGVVYFDVHSRTDDIYRVGVEGNSLLIHRNTQVRLNANPNKLSAAVFTGDVQLENQPQVVTARKKETLSLDPGNPSGYKIVNVVETLPEDAWSKEREAYDNTYAKNAGYGGPRSGYGLQDLNYYGSFSYAPGYGNIWQPYGFDGAMMGFNPYGNGAWMFYPGMGYTWASGYPWGWLPYHYGSWAFIGGGIGWAWVPGSYIGPWYATNFLAVPKIVKAPAGWSPASPPASPVDAPQPTVMVGKKVGATAYIPGGRIPPNFASVIRGRSFAPNAMQHDGVGVNSRAGAANGHGFGANAGRYSVPSAHVFFPPPPAPVIAPIGGSSLGAGSAGTVGVRGTGAASPAAMPGGQAGTTTHGGNPPHK